MTRLPTNHRSTNVRSIVSSIIAINVTIVPSGWAVTIWGADSLHNQGGDSIVTFDSSNPAGTIQAIGHTGVSGFVSGLDFDRQGDLYATTQSISAPGNFYRINQATGQATLIGPLNLGGTDRGITDLTYNPATDQFVGVAFDGSNNYLYTIDKSTGAGALVGTINSPGSIFLGICANSSGQLFLEDVAGQMRVLNGLNAVAMSGHIGVSTFFSQGMTMDWSNGGAWYLAATWQLQPGTFNAAGDVRLIDNATGATSQVLGVWPQNSGNNYPIYAIGDVAVKPIPEPAGALMLGLITIGALNQRRHRRNADGCEAHE